MLNTMATCSLPAVKRLMLSCLIACGCVRSRSAPAPPCPVAGETALDCPWAGVAREAASDPRTALQRDAPTIVDQLRRDARAPRMLSAWGLALNVNQKSATEFGHDAIVAPA